ATAMPPRLGLARVATGIGTALWDATMRMAAKSNLGPIGRERLAVRFGSLSRGGGAGGRRGFTLLELLVVMAVGAALAMAAFQVFVPMMHVHARYVAEVARQTQTWEIADLWRRDAAAAGAVRLSDATSGSKAEGGTQDAHPRGGRSGAAEMAAAWSVEFRSPEDGRTVSYRFYPEDGMLRRYVHGGRVNAGGDSGATTVHVRQWRIDGEATARVHRLGSGHGSAADRGTAEAERALPQDGAAGESSTGGPTIAELRLRYRLLVPVSGRSLEGRFREYAVVGVVR
ncbi:MAG: prepilin-type N-terminal cleavage/methylation domain-containing protein, partial [Planctomycetota bacterium]